MYRITKLSENSILCESNIPINVFSSDILVNINNNNYNNIEIDFKQLLYVSDSYQTALMKSGKIKKSDTVFAIRNKSQERLIISVSKMCKIKKKYIKCNKRIEYNSEIGTWLITVSDVSINLPKSHYRDLRLGKLLGDNSILIG